MKTKRFNLGEFRWNTISLMDHMFETLKIQYPKGYNTEYLDDRRMTYAVKLINHTNKETIKETFQDIVKYVSQIQTDIALHNLRNQGVL